ncbi:MAG: hypothetical protein K0Q43_1720 [Ramlibacter sp.]|jgi:hypothetical protein|nr:hypothetical protein [Ramlibacter sp.]
MASSDAASHLPYAITRSTGCRVESFALFQ